MERENDAKLKMLQDLEQQHKHDKLEIQNQKNRLQEQMEERYYVLQQEYSDSNFNFQQQKESLLKQKEREY